MTATEKLKSAGQTVKRWWISKVGAQPSGTVLLSLQPELTSVVNLSADMAALQARGAEGIRATKAGQILLRRLPAGPVPAAG